MINIDMFVGYYNFDTGDYDSYPEVPDDLTPYLPREPKAARALFKAYIKVGQAPLDAYISVMERLIGEDND